MSEDKSLFSRIVILKSSHEYAVWRTGIQTYLLSVGCLGILEGTDLEPGRLEEAATYNRDRQAELDAAVAALQTAVDSQNVANERSAGEAAIEANIARIQSFPPAGQADDVVPGVPRQNRSGTVPPLTWNRPMTDAESKLWMEWSKREMRVQGVLRGTVSKGILVDLINKQSALAMWAYLEATNPINTPENQAKIRRDLANLSLRDLSPKGMERHLDTFNELIMNLITAGETLTPSDRAQRFLDTFPYQLATIRTVYSITQHTIPVYERWSALLKLYNEEIMRRGVDRRRGGGEAVFYTNEKPKRG